jgi:RNA polymerase sigma factor (sigma-70 family)
VTGDADLTRALVHGDRDALGEIYDRYGDTVYELCRVILRDARAAEEATQDTFVTAATRASELRNGERLKAWLCAIARREAGHRAARRRRGPVVAEPALDVSVTDDSAGGLLASETFSLVRESVDELPERERAVLVLHIREGLNGADLSSAVGLPGPTATDALALAQTHLASAVRCIHLVRTGRDKCHELAAIARGKHMAMDTGMRKRVSRHAADCMICRPTWQSAPDAISVLGAAPLLGAPVALKQQIVRDPRLISRSTLLGGTRWTPDGFPPVRDADLRRRLVVAAAAAAVLLVVIGALVLDGRNDGDGPVSRLAVPHRVTTTVSTATTAPLLDAAVATTVPGGVTTTSLRRTTTTTRRTATTAARPGGGPGATTPPTSPATTAPSLTISASAQSTRLTCNTGTTGVTATTSGSQQPNGLFLHWADSSGSGGSKNMARSGGSSWTGTLGPFDHLGKWSWWVSTSLFSGGTRSATHSVDVVGPC